MRAVVTPFSPHTPLNPPREVRSEATKPTPLGEAREALRDALPPQQRHSATTALARLAELGLEEAVLREWSAGRELHSRGELGRFSPAATFFFLFGVACRGAFRPLWGPALAASRQAEADARQAEAQRAAQEVEAAETLRRRNAAIRARATELLDRLGEAEIRDRVRRELGDLAASASDPHVLAEILAGGEEDAR